MRAPEKTFEIGRLKRRADFLRVAKGKRWHGKAMTVQAASSDGACDGASDGGRIGFTLTRKVGNAIVRNRARRRLKEAVRLSVDLPVQRDHDYVIVGRIDAIRQPFLEMRADLVRAFRAIKDKRSIDPTRPRRPRPIGKAPPPESAT